MLPVALPYRRYLAVVGIMVSIAVAIRFIWGVSAAVTLGILLIGWPVAGTLITLDDDFPGGCSNLDGTAIPEWKTSWWWADLLLVRGALVVVAFVIEGAIAGAYRIGLLVAASIMMSIGLPIFVRALRKVSSNPARPESD